MGYGYRDKDYFFFKIKAASLESRYEPKFLPPFNGLIFQHHPRNGEGSATETTES